MKKLVLFAFLGTVACCLTPATASAQEVGHAISGQSMPTASASEDKYERNDWRRDRFYFNVGGLFLTHDTVDELNARDFPLGTVIDWEDTFGLAETTSSFRVEGHIKVAKRHRFRFSYFKTNRAADEVLIDEELQWGDITIPVDVRINSVYDTRVIRGDYRFSFIQSDKVDLGLALGVYLLRVSSDVGINDTSIRTGVTQSAPLPMVGLDVEWDFAQKFVFKGGFQYLGVKLGDTTTFDGNWLELRARLEWMPFRNLGLGVGYLQGDVSVDIGFGSGVLQDWSLNYDTGGMTVYALASF